MIEPLTPVTDLHSRLGRVGSIQAWDPWRSRESVAHAKWWVATVASLSYGNDEAKNPEALFDQIVRRGHLSCLEFVPFDDLCGDETALPGRSWRQVADGWEWDRAEGFDPEVANAGMDSHPASAFLVEAPIYVARQWMRHRSFSYLEMSRRYTKGSKVAWEYYGTTGEPDDMAVFHAACEAEYQRRLDAGWPNEIARGAMPVETLTRFWVAGFDRDWEHFCNLRTDAHAQPEIRVYADWIQAHIRAKG